MRNPLPDPPDVRRAAYLRETGRLDQLAAEGLEHVPIASAGKYTTLAIDTTGAEAIMVDGKLAYLSVRPGTKAEQLAKFFNRKRGK
jgi:hypothetical protein